MNSLQFLLLCVCLVATVMVNGTKITINLNNKTGKTNGRNGMTPRATSIQNSHTGTKIVENSNRVSSTVNTDNVHKVEKAPVAHEYFRKAHPVQRTTVDHSK
jgi:hypothetical protein